MSEVVVFGRDELFVLLSKTSNKEGGWIRSIKAMEIVGIGCVIQSTIFCNQGESIAEALTFVPGVKIYVDDEGNRYLGHAGGSII